MLKLVSSRDTLCLHPAIIHLPSRCDTLSGGAPHSSLGKARTFGCANAEIGNEKHDAARMRWFMLSRIVRAHRVSNVSAAYYQAAPNFVVTRLVQGQPVALKSFQSLAAELKASPR
jgi:hypothetical protein